MYKSEQLAHSIRQLIESGTLNAHEKLPSLRDQVQRSGFSLMTVMNAYQELESQGLIYSKEKSGYFVAEQIALKPLEQYSIVSLNSKIEINSLVLNILNRFNMSLLCLLVQLFLIVNFSCFQTYSNYGATCTAKAKL